MTPIQTHGKNGRPLKHQRADWITNPAEFSIPPYRTEFQFHPVRRWRFDYAWPEHRVALEIDGGSGAWGRHSRPEGMRGDHEKVNTATTMGWRVFRVLAGEETRVTTLRLLQSLLTTDQAA